MYRHLAIILCIVLLVALPGPVLALGNLPQHLSFEHLTIDDGLSQNASLDILQDSRGFLWIATQNGLNRYDGSSFTVWHNEPENPNSLSNSSILSLAEGQNGVIWIGTWGSGLNRLDPATGKIDHFRHNPADQTTLSNDTVTDLLVARDGTLWIATMGGLDHMNADGTLKHYLHDPANPNSLSSNNISALYQSKDGNLWVGTGFMQAGSGLNRINLKTGEFSHFQHAFNIPRSISSNNIASIFEDRRGVMWIGTGGYGIPGAGLNYINEDGTFSAYRNEPGQPNSLASDIIMSIWQDAVGNIWAGTWGGGLDVFDPSLALPKFQHTRNDPYDPHSLSSDTIWDIFADRSGVVWIGTLNGGVNKLNPTTNHFNLFQNNPGDPNSLGFNVVGGFYEDRRGLIWVATWGGGLDVFFRESGMFRHYKNDPAKPNSLHSNNVMSMFEDDRGTFWVGTLNGLTRFNIQNGTFSPILHDAEQPDTTPLSDSITGFLQAAPGKVWIGTLGGLELYDHETKTFTHYLNNPNDSASLSHNSVVSLFRDDDDVIWLGTWGGGLNRLNADGTFTRFQHQPYDSQSISDDSVWAISQDHQGTLWIGTQSGLNRMNADGTFTRYGIKEGLPSEVIMGVLEDANKNLWISTSNGLARFNPESGKIRVFDVRDGLQSNEFNSSAFCKDIYGNMYFGGIHGFNRFDPESIQDNLVPPPVAITTFRVFNEPVPIDLSGQTTIELPYWQDFIAFEFAALDFRAPDKNQYAYQLENFDNDWIDSGSRRYASYTNLPGGEYVFRVKAANGDGVWNETGVAIPIIITPPFWETIWFRGGVIFLFIGLLLTGYTVRVRGIQAQKKALETEVAVRTEELSIQIEQRQRAEAALAQKAAEEAVSLERTRLARDLHDSVTQTLFSASLVAEVLPELWQIDAEEARRSTDELTQLTRGALAEMRTLLLELRPAALTQSRLGDLLKQLVEALAGRSRLPIKLHVDGARVLPPDVQVAFYRIAQESLNNIFKYSRATQVDIHLLLSASGAHLEIMDNGVGFDKSRLKPASLGMRIMQERAEAIGADFSVTSTPGKGTMVSVTWNEKP